MKKLTFKILILAFALYTIPYTLYTPTYAQYSDGTGSISVSPSSITKTGSGWPSLTISGTVNVPGANNSYTVAKVHWKKSTDSGWTPLSDNRASFGLNGSYSFSWTPSSGTSTGSYQFSLWRMRPDGSGNHILATSGTIQFVDACASGTCSACTSCGACIASIGMCGWANGTTCRSGSSSACPAGVTTSWAFTSCSNVVSCTNPTPTPPACTTYTISGRVATSSGTGVSGATVCLDPTSGGSCASSSFRTTTSGTGNYTLNNVTSGGSGHTVYVVPSGFTVSNNSQVVGGTVCQSTTINFNATFSSGQGYLAQFERCVGGSWQPIAGNRCTTVCGTPGAPSPTASPTPGPTSTPTPPPPAQPGDPWIQTEDGDVHSNTGITTP